MDGNSGRLVAWLSRLKSNLDLVTRPRGASVGRTMYQEIVFHAIFWGLGGRRGDVSRRVLFVLDTVGASSVRIVLQCSDVMRDLL